MNPVEIYPGELHRGAAVLMQSAQIHIAKGEMEEAKALVKCAGLLKHAATELAGRN